MEMTKIFIKKNSSHTTRIVYNKGVTYLEFPALSDFDFLVHGFSTRLGGVSKGDLKAMNLSFSRGDDPKNVMENYVRIADAIGFPVENIVTVKQEHTNLVERVGKNQMGRGIIQVPSEQGCDGMVTNEPGVILATSHADCVPIYFVDPKKKAIGLCHSGWKGTVHLIGKETLNKMKAEFQSEMKDIIACIGPSICKDCYEVSEDVAVQFKYNFPVFYHKEILKEKVDGKYQLDLWRANEIILLESGILPEHIHTTDICTCCNNQVLFSHRGNQGKRGNMMAFLGLIPQIQSIN